MDKMTIPVQVDSVTSGKDSSMVRCVYYRVETAGGPGAPLHSITGDAGANMAIWSDWAILTGPDPSVSDGGLFDSPESIDRTIELLEKSEEKFLDLAHIWLPAVLFEKGSKKNAIRNGDVYRISMPLFSACYSFISENISEEEWLKECGILSGDLSPSQGETDAFRVWRKQEVEIARKRYHDESYSRHRLMKKKGDRK